MGENMGEIKLEPCPFCGGKAEFELGKKTKWIPVEERLPEKEYDTVLCVTDKNHYFVAVYNKEYGFRTGDIYAEGEVIAWMPLPYHTERIEP